MRARYKTFLRFLASSCLLCLLLIGMAFLVGVARAGSGTVYINADGSVQGTSSIVSSDNETYILVANVSATIAVRRSNTVIDGNGFTVQGTYLGGEITGKGSGIDLSGVENITVKNTLFASSSHGVYASSCSSVNVTENSITGNWVGIWIDNVSNINMFENNLTTNSVGIWFNGPSSHNLILGNNIVNNSNMGIGLFGYGNTIVGNNITGCYYGMWIYSSSGNLIFHNNFVNNTFRQVYIDTPGNTPNVWDNGYPSGGNYWSDYTTRYPNVVEVNDSGIWNTPYQIPGNGTDRYPLQNMYTGSETPPIPEFPSVAILMLVFASTTLLTIAIRKKKRVDREV